MFMVIVSFFIGYRFNVPEIGNFAGFLSIAIYVGFVLDEYTTIIKSFASKR